MVANGSDPEEAWRADGKPTTRGNFDGHIKAQRVVQRTADGEADDSAPATSRRSRAA